MLRLFPTLPRVHPSGAWVPALWRDIIANELAYWAQLSEVHIWPEGVFFVHESLTSPPVNGVRDVQVAPGQEVAFAQEARAFFAQRGRSAQLQVNPWAASPRLREALAQAGWIRVEDIIVMVADAPPEPSPPSPHLSWHVVEASEMSQWVSVLVGSFELPASPTFTASLCRRFRQGTTVSYLAEWDGKPAGCAQLFREAGVAGIYAVGTLPAFRRRGIASALVGHLMREAIAHEDHVCLQVIAGSPAEQVYVRLGFQRLFAQECYYLPR
ncbi:MAG: GNAT family N-acetyltransferase [Anaerolineae bacterium]|nr:GNAT family N-acetyltransferase [Anaerolineae bacterium]MDW8100797.1 GNAT family N-acetyltransferase [Anaerolineae bacterium]